MRTSDRHIFAVTFNKGFHFFISHSLSSARQVNEYAKWRIGCRKFCLRTCKQSSIQSSGWVHTKEGRQLDTACGGKAINPWLLSDLGIVNFTICTIVLFLVDIVDVFLYIYQLGTLIYSKKWQWFRWRKKSRPSTLTTTAITTASAAMPTSRCVTSFSDFIATVINLWRQ